MAGWCQQAPGTTFLDGARLRQLVALQYLTTAFTSDGTPAWRRGICRFPLRTVLKDRNADWKDPANWTCR